MIRKGEPWERPAAGPPERVVRGSDADVAAAVRGTPGARIALAPSAGCDLARALGIRPDAVGQADPGTASGAEPGARPHDLAVDALRVTTDDGREHFGVNALVLGTPPDRLSLVTPHATCTVTVGGRVVHDGPATTVVVASGQYLHGADVVPRGHPGDGRIEVQVYAPRRGEARQVARRVRVGDHLPHPRIRQAVGTAVDISAVRPVRLELDGVGLPAAARLSAVVLPGHFVVVV